MVLAGEVLAVSSLDRLPAEAATELEIRRHFNIKSLVALPLKAGKEPVFGCLAFLTVGRERVWEDDTVQRLRLVAEIFANALARKRAEERLLESESKYRTVVERMNDGLIVLDERHRITYVNKKLCEMLGVPEDELLGRSPADYLDEGSRAVYAAQLEKRVRGENTPYEVEWLTKSGSRLVTIVTPQPIFSPSGSYRGAFSVLTDVSERKRAEALLRDDVERLRYILEATSGGVWDWNILTGAAVFSPKYSAMLGYEPEEFAKHYDQWGMIVHPDDIERVKQAHADHFEERPDVLGGVPDAGEVRRLALDPQPGHPHRARRPGPALEDGRYAPGHPEAQERGAGDRPDARRADPGQPAGHARGADQLPGP